MEEVEVSFVKCLLERKYSLKDITEVLQRRFPSKKGFSLRSVERFCQKHGISSRIKQEEIENTVTKAVEQVGPTYGRKMMSGFIRSEYGLEVGQNRVGAALATVFPRNHQQRRNGTAAQVNPIPYRADYFGHKVHFDQNEKLVMYGVTHVAAIDGHSRFVVGACTMPIKNNLIIYEEVYRKAVLCHGMFDQIRDDGGKEFYLMLGIQEIFEGLRGNKEILPYRQTQSKQNLPIERFWPEVNARVNYPIKKILVEIDNRELLDMSDEVIRYCVSKVACDVAHFGLQQVIASWNMHPIAGRGTPSVIKERTNHLPPIADNTLPEAYAAKALYEETYSGRLTDESIFGNDPLARNDEAIAQRNQMFTNAFDIPQIFGDLVNNRPVRFQQALFYFINITQTLASNM